MAGQSQADRIRHDHHQQSRGGQPDRREEVALHAGSAGSRYRSSRSDDRRPFGVLYRVPVASRPGAMTIPLEPIHTAHSHCRPGWDASRTNRANVFRDGDYWSGLRLSSWGAVRVKWRAGNELLRAGKCLIGRHGLTLANACSSLFRCSASGNGNKFSLHFFREMGFSKSGPPLSLWIT